MGLLAHPIESSPTLLLLDFQEKIASLSIRGCGRRGRTTRRWVGGSRLLVEDVLDVPQIGSQRFDRFRYRCCHQSRLGGSEIEADGLADQYGCPHTSVASNLVNR